MTLNQELQVVFILKNMGFPFGMASAQRVRLMAKSLLEAGAKVNVLCVSAFDKNSEVVNENVSGNYDGIPFEYTPGITYRKNSFLERRYLEFKGVSMALWNIWNWKKVNENIRVYLYGFSSEPNFSIFAITLSAKLLQIPVAIELCERPWVMSERKRNLLHKLPIFMGIAGVITISKFLEDWCHEEARTKKYKIKVLRVPILAELSKDSLVEAGLTERPSVLLACSKSYDDTVEFVLQAMLTVWKSIPDCNLVITGSVKYQQKVNQFLANTNQDKSRVILTGYIPREELFKTYKRSWALLIPLFNNIRSIARFPTKIGEYLSTSRPIVTTNFGEISSFFVDGQNAFVAQEESAEAFGRKILEAVLNPENATTVGKNGLLTCYKNFDYSQYASRLYDFFFRTLK